MQVRTEITQLAQRVADLKPKRILEIGTDRAGTLLIWASLATEQVITCDIRDLSMQKELFTSLKPPNSQCDIQILNGDSHTHEFHSRVKQALGGNQVDFLFIDGDHTEAGVEQDYNEYKEFVRPGGLIAFHDIVDQQPYPTNQVQFFWKRLKQKAKTEELVNDWNQVGCGIGVVTVE